MIGSDIDIVADLNMMFFVWFRTSFQVVSRCWVPSHVFNLLGCFSTSMDFLMVLLVLFAVGYDFETIEIDFLLYCVLMFLFFYINPFVGLTDEWQSP